MHMICLQIKYIFLFFVDLWILKYFSFMCAILPHLFLIYIILLAARGCRHFSVWTWLLIVITVTYTVSCNLMNLQLLFLRYPLYLSLKQIKSRSFSQNTFDKKFIRKHQGLIFKVCIFVFGFVFQSHLVIFHLKPMFNPFSPK